MNMVQAQILRKSKTCWRVCPTISPPNATHAVSSSRIRGIVQRRPLMLISQVEELVRETLVCLVVETEELDMGLECLEDQAACHHLFIEHLAEAVLSVSTGEKTVDPIAGRGKGKLERTRTAVVGYSHGRDARPPASRRLPKASRPSRGEEVRPRPRPCASTVADAGDAPQACAVVAASWGRRLASTWRRPARVPSVCMGARLEVRRTGGKAWYRGYGRGYERPPRLGNNTATWCCAGGRWPKMTGSRGWERRRRRDAVRTTKRSLSPFEAGWVVVFLPMAREALVLHLCCLPLFPQGPGLLLFSAPRERAIVAGAAAAPWNNWGLMRNGTLLFHSSRDTREGGGPC